MRTEPDVGTARDDEGERGEERGGDDRSGGGADRGRARGGFAMLRAVLGDDAGTEGARGGAFTLSALSIGTSMFVDNPSPADDVSDAPRGSRLSRPRRNATSTSPTSATAHTAHRQRGGACSTRSTRGRDARNAGTHVGSVGKISPADRWSVLMMIFTCGRVGSSRFGTRATSARRSPTGGMYSSTTMPPRRSGCPSARNSEARRACSSALSFRSTLGATSELGSSLVDGSARCRSLVTTTAPSMLERRQARAVFAEADGEVGHAASSSWKHAPTAGYPSSSPAEPTMGRVPEVAPVMGAVTWGEMAASSPPRPTGELSSAPSPGDPRRGHGR